MRILARDVEEGRPFVGRSSKNPNTFGQFRRIGGHTYGDVGSGWRIHEPADDATWFDDFSYVDPHNAVCPDVQ